jgi:hypothetical protein
MYNLINQSFNQLIHGFSVMKTLPSSKSLRENFTIRMAPNLKKALKIQAIEENRDPSDLIEDAVKVYLSQPAS